MDKSKNNAVHSPNTNMLLSCTTAEWWYLGAGGFPVVKALQWKDQEQLVACHSDCCHWNTVIFVFCWHGLQLASLPEWKWKQLFLGKGFLVLQFFFYLLFLFLPFIGHLLQRKNFTLQLYWPYFLPDSDTDVNQTVTKQIKTRNVFNKNSAQQNLV